jgi:hypothetical protein
VVTSNDPNTPSTSVTLACFIKEHISIKPNNRFNLTGYEGDELSQKLTITATEGQEFDIKEVKTDLTDKIKYKLETVQKGKEYTLEVMNLTQKEGFVRGQIEISTTSQKKPLIVLPVFVKIQSEVEVKPASLYFGKIDTAGGPVNPEILTKSVVIKMARGKELDIKKVSGSSNWIKTETKTDEKGVQYTVAITLNKDKMPKGKFDEKVEIKTNKKNEPLIVGIKGEVM